MALTNMFLIPVTRDMGINRGTFSIGNAILQAIGIFLAPLMTKKLAAGNLKRIQMISIAYLGATMIPISIMITNWFDKKRGLAMSLGLSGVGIGGFILSPLITNWLENYG